MGGRKDKAECMQFSMGQLYYWFKLQWPGLARLLVESCL